MKTPRSKTKIVALLQSKGEKFARIFDGASEAFLGKEYEMHHRGHLMKTERLLGITPHLTPAMDARPRRWRRRRRP